jgi:GT2 family glycosyltransferase
MYFYQDYHPYKLWINMHYYKGLPATWPDASHDRAVPAVTGAALLINRSLFEKIGGWDESYVLANYEDSDLCLRLFKAGYSSWYCSSVEMYHLERQSQRAGEEDAVRRNSDFYNRWLQTHRWNDLIAEIMSRHQSLVVNSQAQSGGAT